MKTSHSSVRGKYLQHSTVCLSCSSLDKSSFLCFFIAFSLFAVASCCFLEDRTPSAWSSKRLDGGGGAPVSSFSTTDRSRRSRHTGAQRAQRDVRRTLCAFLWQQRQQQNLEIIKKK